MSELRQNILTGNWTVMAPERGSKPEGFKAEKGDDLRDNPAHADNCPFCPGNDDSFDVAPIFEIPGSAGSWSSRLIENKYKIFDDYVSCPAQPEPFEQDGIYAKYQGCGNHYLVIDNPVHNRVIGQMEQTAVEGVLRCYLKALELVEKNPNNLIGIIFKNQGFLAGGSQPHAHSQIVGSRVVPAWIRYALHAQEKCFDTRGICAMCAILKYEREQSVRVAFENDGCMVLSPYAAGTPYEMWVVPTRHMSWYGSVSDDEIAAIAEGLRLVLGTYVEKLGNPDFNYFIHSAPSALAGIPYYHTYIQVLPRLWNEGGFEMGTRIPVNVMQPEEAVKMFRR